MTYALTSAIKSTRPVFVPPRTSAGVCRFSAGDAASPNLQGLPSPATSAPGPPRPPTHNHARHDHDQDETRPRPLGPPVADEKKDKPDSVNMLYSEEVIYCVDISEGATPYSSSCRRRSVRIAGIPDISAVEVQCPSSCGESCSDSLLNLMPFGSSPS